MNPEVSVVMSVFNDRERVTRSVEGVLSQSGVRLELIVVDDGSTDGTAAVLETLAARDERLRLVRQENRGITRSLRRACALARGQYLARQDSGDHSQPGRISAQLDVFKRNQQVVLVVTGVRELIAGHVVGRIVPDGDVASLTRRLRVDMMGIPAHGCTMFRRDAFEKAGGYRDEFYYAQDCDLWLRLAPLGDVGSVPEELYDLDVGVGGVSSNSRTLQGKFASLAHEAYRLRCKGESDEKVLDVVRSLRATAERQRGRRVAPYRRAAEYYRAARLLDRAGHDVAADMYREALRICPYYWRAWRRLLN